KRIVWLDSDGAARYRGDFPNPILAEFQRLLTLSSIRLMNVYDSQVNQLLGEALAIALLDQKHILKAFSGAREFIAKHDPVTVIARTNEYTVFSDKEGIAVCRYPTAAAGLAPAIAEFRNLSQISRVSLPLKQRSALSGFLATELVSV